VINCENIYVDFESAYQNFVSRGSISHIYLCFWKETTQESDNVEVFPFACHITVQQPFKPLWSRLLLYELETSRTSFALCSKPLLITLLPASVLVSLFVSRLPFDLSSKGGPASSYATAGIALRVTDPKGFKILASKTPTGIE